MGSSSSMVEPYNLLKYQKSLGLVLLSAQPWHATTWYEISIEKNIHQNIMLEMLAIGEMSQTSSLAFDSIQPIIKKTPSQLM